MGSFYNNFNVRIRKLWETAHRIEKPCDPSLTWCAGLVNARTDFFDLQAHGAALFASIIIQEPVLPSMHITWDTLFNYRLIGRRFSRDVAKNADVKPDFLLSLFPEIVRNKWEEEKSPDSHYEHRTKYVSLFRAPLSVSPNQGFLGAGYRAKYLGIDMVTTPHGILSDIDTVCTQPSVQFLKDRIAENPNTFCLSNWNTEQFTSVGLCVYNMVKYQSIFRPYLQRTAWMHNHKDSTFIPMVKRLHPEIADQLDVRIFDGHVINAEKFYPCPKRGNFYEEGKTTHYHAWKGEERVGKEKFNKFYSDILDDLQHKAEVQCAKK